MTNYSIEDYLSAQNATGPALSSTAKAVAFLSNKTGTFQIFHYDIQSGETIQLTDYDDGVNFVDFSPVNDEIIIFSKDSGGDENAQLFLMNIKDRSVVHIKQNPKAQYSYGGWSRDGTAILYASNERNGTDNDTYVYDYADKTHTLLYDGGGRSYPTGFSPTGRYVIVSRLASLVNNDLFLIDRQDANREPELLTPHDGSNLYFAPRWLMDESGFFFIGNEGNEFSCLCFYDLSTHERTIVKEYGWDVDGVSMSKDRTLMTVRTNEDGYEKLRLYSVDGRSISEIAVNDMPEGEIGSHDPSEDGSLLAYALSSFDSSTNVWLWDRNTNTHTQISDLKFIVPRELLVKPELTHYRSFDGLEIPLFVWMPRDQIGRIPAIVLIHGGPEGQTQPGFFPLVQYWVSQGYAVLAPNVRGSTGYGRTYVSLDDTRKRLDSVEDLRGLHEWAATDERIDSTRMALYGGSYGGYMVLAGLAFQPDLWAAGVDIVGIANFVTFLENTSPYRRKLREAEYGSLETDREFLEAASPINKIDDIKAPLIIIHGANDPRVPLDEAKQVYESLRARGIESEFLVYEDEGHGLAKLRNRLDAYPKVAAFLQDVFKA